ASTTIPIVALMVDPVEEGLAASLAQPGGNVTGLSAVGVELFPKRVELLKEMTGRATRVAGLWDFGAVGGQAAKKMRSDAEIAAEKRGVQLQLVEVKTPDELDGAFSAIAQKQPNGLVVFESGPLFFHRRRLVELAAKHRLPTIYFVREFVGIGGLI